MVSRRQFLAQSVLGVASSLLGTAFAASSSRAEPGVIFPTQARERIAVASYSFRKFIATPGRQAKNSAPAKIELIDFPAHVISRFNINKVELWTGHFPDPNARYLTQFRAALQHARATVVNIAADGEHSPYSADPGERNKAVAFGKRWVDVAAALGSRSLRTNIPAARRSKPAVGLTAATLAQVVAYSSSKKVVVNLENDDPVSEDPFFLVKVIDRVNSPWLRALPDFANTSAATNELYAYSGIDALFARAYSICHVRESQAGPDGKIIHVNMGKAFQIMKRRNYKGYCSMEYDSPGDPYAGTAALIAQTVRYLS